MSIHSTLTGSDLHEPKAVSSASMNTVYVADGSGSGTWSPINTSCIDGTFENVNRVMFTGAVPDLSTNGSNYLIAIPVNVTITSIELVLANSITSAPGSLSVINGGVGTMATLTVPYIGSGKGTVQTQALTSNNAVLAGGYVEVKANSGSSTTCICYFTLTGTVTSTL